MGLSIGKLNLRHEIRSFSKFSKASILRVATAFHNLSDGFGISSSEAAEILADVNDSMQMSKDSVMFLSIGLFKLLDTDENGLIDGLEFLSVLAMVSGMYKYEILEFIFALYDFSNAASLNFDEVVLAIKNTTNGLLKLQNEDESLSILSLPTDLLVEELVIKLFSSLNVSQEGLWNARIEIRTLAANSLLIPEISNWIDYFNDFAYEEESKKFQTCDRLDIMRLRTYDDVCTNSILKFERMKFIRQVNQTYQWKSQVALLTPIEYANISLPKSSPPTEFSLEWVYGLETNRTLRHISYTKNDEIMYFVGNQVCIYSPQMNTQRSRSYHGTDICALQISREHNLFAVGNVGLDPTIFVCDVDTMQILGELNLIGSNDAFDINFSHDGSTLLIVDNSERKIVTVWDYQTKTILFKDLLSKGIIFSSAVLLKDKYVISQDNHINFWIKGEEGYLKREGVWVKNKKPEALSVVLCTSFGDNLVGGTVHGALVLFHGYTCVKYITAHTGPVTALISCSEGYLTGSKDSRIRMWSSNLEPKFLFDISKFSAFPCITSLSLSSDSSVIMFSTIACEVFEISALDGSDVRGGPVVQGHRFGDINDLDTHPSKLEAATVGSDRTLRVFDLSLKGQIKLANLGFEGTTVAYSPLGDTIAVGAACVQGHDYKFAILSEESLAILHIARDNNSVVTVLKYSTDGELLAVGCSDGGIYLYSIPDEYDLVCKCVRHNRPICGIDFSKEGEWLRSNSVDGELHFFSADDGSYQSNLSSMRDIAWSSQDCIYSWHSKGIHSGSSISEEFPVVSSVSNEEAPSILVTGTSMGSLRAYTYPCVEDTAEFQHFYAHTARIAKVKFSFDNSLLLSVGTKDRTVLQFKLNRKGLVVRDPTPTPAFIETMYEVSTDSEREIFSVSTLSDWGKQKDNAQFDWDKFLVGKQVKEDLQFHSLPPVTLMLERVYGYEASRILGNIQYLSDSEIFYTAGNFGIILNRVNETQRIYQFHRTVICSCAITRDRKYLCTGDQSNFSVWDALSMETEFSSSIYAGSRVDAVGFSENDRYLICIRSDDFHSLQIFDWKNKTLIAKTFTGSQSIYQAVALKEKSTLESLVTIGSQHIKFWKSFSNGYLHCISPDLSELTTSYNFICCVSNPMNTVVGTDDGYLCVFQEYQLRQTVKAHSSAVVSLAFNEKSKSLYSGGVDGVVRVWNSSLECLKEISLESMSKSHNFGCKAIAVSSDNHVACIGTFGGDLLEFDIRKNQLLNEIACSRGHTMKLSGLACHPKHHSFVTTGDDAILRIWNSKSRTHVRTLKLDHASRAAEFTPDGTLLVVGFGNGKKIKGKSHAKEGALSILNFENFKVLMEKKDANESISIIKFSPSGKIMAVGSDDCCVYLYSPDDNFLLKNIVRSHEAPLRRMDFLKDSSAMVTVDSSFKVCYTSLPLGLPLTSMDEVEEENFVDSSNIFTRSARAMWLVQHGNRQLKSVAKAKGYPLLACANDHGEIFLFNNPSPFWSGFLMSRGHTGEVGDLKWSFDDQCFLSIGVQDCVVLQWRIFPLLNVLGSISENVPTVESDVKPQFEEDESIVWSRQIIPNEPVLPISSKRDFDLELQFVYGIGGHGRSIGYNMLDNIVFFSGNFVKLFDAHENSQKLYYSHNKAISALTFNETMTLAATGDSSGEIHLWDALIAKTIQRFPHLIAGAVRDLSFSPSANYLISLNADLFNTIIVFHSPSGLWSDGRYLCSSSATKVELKWCRFLGHGDFPIVAGGDGLLYTFKISQEAMVKRTVTADQGIKTALCCAAEVMLSIGDLSLPKKYLVCGSLEAHDTTIVAITALKNCPYGTFATLASDSIKLWSSSMTLTRTIEFHRLCRIQNIPATIPGSFCHNSNQQTILVHFSNGYLIEISIELLSMRCICESHTSGELHALDTNPRKPQEFLSCGDDGVLRIWDSNHHYCLKRKQLPYSCRSVKFHSTENTLVGGASEPHSCLKNPKSGIVFVLDRDTLEILREEKKSKGAITDVLLTSDGARIAFCTSEGNVILCEYKSLQTLMTINLQYKRPSVRCDFSSDNEFLRILFAPDRITYFSCGEGKEYRDPNQLLHLKWNSTNSIYTWNTQGVFNQIFGEVTSLLVLNTKVLVCYDSGEIRLFPYPCWEKEVESKFITKISSYAPRMILNQDQTKILIVDAKSYSIVQMEVRHL